MSIENPPPCRLKTLSAMVAVSSAQSSASRWQHVQGQAADCQKWLKADNDKFVHRRNQVLADGSTYPWRHRHSGPAGKAALTHIWRQSEGELTELGGRCLCLPCEDSTHGQQCSLPKRYVPSRALGVIIFGREQGKFSGMFKSADGDNWAYDKEVQRDVSQRFAASKVGRCQAASLEWSFIRNG